MKNTERQIKAITNDYHFGIEVEMTGITRKNAAELTSEFFGTASPQRRFDIYDTWFVYDPMGREWKFARDCSIRSSESMQCELITPILDYSDIPMLQELLQLLKHHGAISTPSYGCGVHIHVSRKDGFAVKDIKNMVNIMAAHEKQLAKAIGIASARLRKYCQMVDKRFLDLMHKSNPQTMMELEDLWYESQDCSYDRQDRYNYTRYHALNLHSFFNGHRTIEFRLFQFANPSAKRQGGIDVDELKTFIQLSLAICELAHEVKFASAKPQQTDNEAYALRCWLLRLGFIGDEFKTARQILLRKMSGNCAWRLAC